MRIFLLHQHSASQAVTSASPTSSKTPVVLCSVRGGNNFFFSFSETLRPLPIISLDGPVFSDKEILDRARPLLAKNSEEKNLFYDKTLLE